MSKNAQLIELIKNRKGSGEFGYGITTADRYVRHAVETLGNPMIVKHFHCIGQGGVDGLMKRASQTLTICSKETDMEASVSSIKEMAKILGCDPPPHAMLAMVNRLTTPREDRDGDTLQTAGANMDPKAPLLWQHIHTLPIGKMMRIVSHDKDCLKVATVLLDINELTSDAAKLFEAGALRFSHGFIAREFEERKSSGAGDMARFNILKFDIVEESAVSVPSNVDAEVELFCRGKLASDAFKAHGKALLDMRNKSMAVTEKAKKAVENTSEQSMLADFKAMQEKVSLLEKQLAELAKPNKEIAVETTPITEVKLDDSLSMVGPAPNPGENQSGFMERCMLDSVMMDDYPTEEYRRSACKVQWGKSATASRKKEKEDDTSVCKGCEKKSKLNSDGYCPECAKEEKSSKEMGKCEGCGNDKELNSDGMCADCADDKSDGKEKPEGDNENPFKGGKPSSAKAGRVLSKRNVEILTEAVSDITAASGKIQGIIAAATPEPQSIDHVLRDAIVAVSGDRAARDTMRKAIAAFDKADEREQLAESFRQLESVLSPG